jgi:tellurite resistance protein
VADRKIDETEAAAAVSFLSTLGATDLGEHGDLAAQFRALRSDEATADAAAELLLRQPAELATEVLAAARSLSDADGRVTPKERERLEWMSDGLLLLLRHARGCRTTHRAARDPRSSDFAPQGGRYTALARR